jgi:hypothetical protein
MVEFTKIKSSLSTYIISYKSGWQVGINLIQIREISMVKWPLPTCQPKLKIKLIIGLDRWMDGHYLSIQISIHPR